MSGGIGGGRVSPYSMFTPAIKVLIIMNVIVFVLEHVLTPSFVVYNNSLRQYIHYFVQYTGYWQPGSGYFYVWQVLTYQFLHADVWHILMNMYVLWMFGSEVEAMWGSKRFLQYYFISGIGAGIAHTAMSFVTSQPNEFGLERYVPLVGASGSIMGVMIAFAVMFPYRTFYFFPIFIPIKAWFLVSAYILIEIFKGFMSNDNVAHFAHLGGALTGFLLIKFGDKLGVFGALDKLTGMFGGKKETYHGGRVIDAHFKERTVETEQSTERKVMFHGGTFFHNGEQITPEIVDSILDKINVVGFDNLSDREKEILREVSRRMS